MSARSSRSENGRRREPANCTDEDATAQDTANRHMSQLATSNCARRLPAYGRALMKLRHQGLVPKNGVSVALDNWKLGPFGFRLVIPKDSDPLALDFTGVAGLDVILHVDSRISDVERRNAAARAILDCDPAVLIELDFNRPSDARFIKSRALGIELQEFAR